MKLKDIKVQVMFKEDSILRVVNAELTFKGITDLEKLQDEFALDFVRWCRKNFFQQYYINNVRNYEELLKIYKKEKSL